MWDNIQMTNGVVIKILHTPYSPVFVKIIYLFNRYHLKQTVVTWSLFFLNCIHIIILSSSTILQNCHFILWVWIIILTKVLHTRSVHLPLKQAVVTLTSVCCIGCFSIFQGIGLICAYTSMKCRSNIALSYI